MLEEVVESRTIVLVLHERGGQGLTQHLALDARRRHRRDRIHALADRHRHVLRAQILDEAEDTAAHARVLARHTSRSDTNRAIQGMSENEV